VSNKIPKSNPFTVGVLLQSADLDSQNKLSEVTPRTLVTAENIGERMNTSEAVAIELPGRRQGYVPALMGWISFAQ
jgi:hypothetical protein